MRWCVRTSKGTRRPSKKHNGAPQASKSAIKAVEQSGGSIKTVYHNRLGLRVLLKPEKFEGELPRRARPPPKLMPYYVDYENRGEFSPQMQLQELQQRRNAAMTQSEE